MPRRPHVDLVFPPPLVRRRRSDPGTTVPLSVNQAFSMHWAARKNYLAPWREAVRIAWLSLTPEQQAIVQDQRCSVEVHYPFPDNRRRDPHNYVAPHTKALVDELVCAGVWPDDAPRYVTVPEPILYLGDTVIVRLTPCS